MPGSHRGSPGGIHAASVPRRAPAAAARPGAKTPAAPSDARWVEIARRAALAIFPGLVVLALLVPHLAGRVFWTVAVASLPLVFVLAGYHRWRRICPLAWVAALPARLGRSGRRRAGPWLQAHGYHVAFALFVGSLWLRLVATNGDGYALAAFVAALCVAAAAAGAVYTGKTWCNYLCPVSFVEKLYTEPRGLRDTPNSQCATCTACKPACPDINQENGYWKEILLPSRRDVFFAFPGVVLAFYGYYFLQSGTWSYYFGGAWTNEIGLFRTAFLPGHDARTAGFFFAPGVPRAAAALVTLVAGGAVALAAGRFVEPIVGRALARRDEADEGRRRSLMFTAMAFAAFVSFYSFAGAPTLRLVPGLPHLFQLAVVATATLFLMRRIGRRPAALAEETLARRIVANWQWDEPPPRDLREAFLIHTIRSQSHEEARARLVDLYRTAVRESLESGVVSRADVHRLNALRGQLRIADADHERVMADLADERGGLAAMDALPDSPEKHLQLQTYSDALAAHLERQRAGGAAADDALVRALREQFGVTDEEHARVLEQLVLNRDGIATHLGDLPATIEWTAAAVAALAPATSPASRFLAGLLRRRWTRAAENLQRTLGADASAGAGLLAPDAAARDAAVAALGARVSPATAERLRAAMSQARQDAAGAGLPALLRQHLASSDPYLRAASLYVLDAAGAASASDWERLERDEHPVVAETAACVRASADGRRGADASTLEKMIGLATVGIFAELAPEDLAQLGRAGDEVWYPQGEALCREGAMGDEVFVVLDGEVTITRTVDGVPRDVGVEGCGSCIGELAVLDPAPRAATVTASTIAVRALRLGGEAFRRAIDGSPVLSEAVIRVLVRRLRASLPAQAPVRSESPS